MKKRRVVITGLGVICPCGITTQSFWDACCRGDSPVEQIPAQWREYSDYTSGIWAPLPEIDPTRYGFTKIHLMQYSKSSVLGMCAASQAMENAGFNINCIDRKKLRFSIEGISPQKCGVFSGTGVGGIISLIANETNHIFTPQKAILRELKTKTGESEQCDRLDSLMRMPLRFNPFVVSVIMPNALSSSIGIRYGLTGQNTTVTSACAAGTVAAGHAFDSIRSGSLDMAVAGGAEYLRDEFGGIFRGFDAAKTLVHDYQDPQKANRPFDKNRTGFLLSEGGAAFCVLEELEHAEKRGAQPIAEIRGFAETFDAHSMMTIDPGFSEIERMERMVLNDAGFEPETIDYINTHGTGTIANDIAESEMIKKVFGTRPALNSTKSLTGHTIGAAGAIETAVTALSLKTGSTHISKNIETPVNDLDYVRDFRTQNFKRALTHSFAFGGHNAALALEKID